MLLGIYLALVLGIYNLLFFSCNGHCQAAHPFEANISFYGEANGLSVWQTLSQRVKDQPFNLISLAIFLFAITHTFLAHHFSVLSEAWRDSNVKNHVHPVDSFGVEILRFLGEVEVVFGIWVIPLFVSIALFYDWSAAVLYLDSLKFLEPMFVVVIMALASTRPIVKLAEDLLTFCVQLVSRSSRTWWWVILIMGPISGSLITEPGAMTISALLLAKHFYEYGPSKMFAYGTLGLLFTNISVGGVFTNFAAPPVLMVSVPWGWDTSYMMAMFGWKALVGILISTFCYYIFFRKEFAKLDARRQLLAEERQEVVQKSVPFWISTVHVAFLAWIVVHNHHPVLFIGAFLLFLGFYQATLYYQEPLSLKPAILVGFFLAGLVVHGTLQAWWIAPVLSGVNQEALLLLSSILTAFNDNAEITFLATLIPDVEEGVKYAIVAGAVTGGGLTVIANAPNPLGLALLGKYFDRGVSAVNLLFGALVPTIIMGLCFYFLKSL